ncbi:MAG: hypothetical protein PHP28_11365 [Actinomycetota bacterium]|nr:hypothetical protein [Actinomycetota bacterium]MDD5666359.1 hypothetical protein [Actinomycetota bacterium]
MALKRCRKCGLPLQLSRRYVWPGNGVILSRRDPGMRMIMFEADYFAHMWSALEELIGVNMADAMIRGQHAASQDYMDSNVLLGWRKTAVRHLPLRTIFDRTVSELALFGFAGVELMEYRPGKMLVMRVKHPFDIISIAWGAKGLAEFKEGMSSELAWKREGDDYILTMIFESAGRRGDGETLETMRYMRDAKRELSLEGELLPPQGDRGEPCPSCGLPAALTELEWNEGEGTIRRIDNGRRYIFSTGHVFLGIVRDLEERTGRDLGPLIMKLTKDYHLRFLQGIPIRSRNGAYRAAARYLFAGGFGNVQGCDCGEGYLEMTIGNPFYVPRLVGRIAGLFEYIEDEQADIGYRSPQPQLLELEIRAT